MTNLQDQYTQASVLTGDNLRNIAREVTQLDVSQLTLPEVDAAVDRVAQAIPAGNLPGVILKGLTRISGRRAPAQTVKRDVNMLFRGVEIGLDKAVHRAMFAGPAAVLWGYQNLLKLAGKEAEQAFPDGTWQFYVDYAMREDTAHHTAETQGFDAMLKRHNLSLSLGDRITAWVMAAVHALHDYPALLANEWRERVYIALLQEVTGRYASLYQEWETQKPYGRSSSADPAHNYPTHRQHKFDQFLAAATQDLSQNHRAEWVKRIQAAHSDLAAYQQQLSILAYLEPGVYDETHLPIPLAQAQIGLINQGRYYLLPVCQPHKADPASVETIRSLVASAVAQPTGTSVVELSTLARIRRAAQVDIRSTLNTTLRQGLEQLRQAAILFNSDVRSATLPLTDLRRGERGVGDHPLTIFDTGQTTVFDMSAIFFDISWGISLAEIMTREALSWAAYLHSLPAEPPAPGLVKPLRLPFEKNELRAMEFSAQVAPEVSVENQTIQLRPLQSLRRLFKQRNDLLSLTVGDLLLLYRAIHAVMYQPSDELLAQLERLRQDRRLETAVSAISSLFAANRQPPAVLLPLDATRHHPADRIYPIVFETPLRELDLWGLHNRCLQTLAAYENAVGEKTAVFATFQQSQKAYLSALAGFGQVLRRAKEIAASEENTATLNMLANLPAPLQALLNKIPNRFDVLNDILRGRELFANVGATPRSSLSRFAPAKDDSDKKELVWGVLTDAQGNVRVILRDFRPFVGVLVAAGQRKLAQTLTQHYLETFTQGFNGYIHDLRRITAVSAPKV